MDVEKAVLTAGGLGTRLLPLTISIPKEMFPLFSLCNGKLCVKPILQIIFEVIYEAGIRNFLIITGVGKRAVEDYFTPFHSTIALHKDKINPVFFNYIECFYNKLRSANTMFVTQPSPKGFGDAVMYSRAFVGDQPFVLHAGDDLILGGDENYIKRIINAFKRTDSDAIFYVEKIEDPRLYGVVIGEEEGEFIYVKDVIEKPSKIVSNYAIVAVYVFKPIIFKYIEEVALNDKGEVQLSDAIKLMAIDGRKVIAVKLKANENRIDIGTPERYIDALQKSYNFAFTSIQGHGR
ncbi:MAG: sugar phosphate nucleotidyltransferase [Candidatus Geothermarchaeota archaeon]